MTNEDPKSDAQQGGVNLDSQQDQRPLDRPQEGEGPGPSPLIRRDDSPAPQGDVEPDTGNPIEIDKSGPEQGPRIQTVS